MPPGKHFSPNLISFPKRSEQIFPTDFDPLYFFGCGTQHEKRLNGQKNQMANIIVEAMVLFFWGGAGDTHRNFPTKAKMSTLPILFQCVLFSHPAFFLSEKQLKFNSTFNVRKK